MADSLSTRGDLHLMAALIMQPDSLFDNVLTEEEAREAEAKGYRVARIPIKRSGTDSKA